MREANKKGAQTKKKVSKKVTAPAKRAVSQRKKPQSGRTAEAVSGIRKSYLKSKPACRVTLRLPREAAPDAKNVYVLGDFNEWKFYATPMKRLKNGDFSTTIELGTGRQYRFRYLIDESRWENDWYADTYEKSPFGDSDNSVVIV